MLNKVDHEQRDLISQLGLQRQEYKAGQQRRRRWPDASVTSADRRSVTPEEFHVIPEHRCGGVAIYVVFVHETAVPRAAPRSAASRAT